MMVFMLVYAIALLSHKVSSKYEFDHLGCFKDAGERALKEMHNLSQATVQQRIQACANIASSKGFLVFAVQFNHQCFTGPNSEQTYNKFGPATNCNNGVGGGWANSVYRFKVCRNLIFEPPTEGKMLYNHTVAEHIVESYELCEIQCYMNIDCKSCNVGPSSVGGMSCQLNSADRYQYPSDYTNSTVFSYHGTKNLCNITSPCIDGAVCKPGLGGEPYRCECPLRHSGEHCKKLVT